MEDYFRVAEWTIENVSCWRLELHGNCIESAVTYLPDVKFLLYPRGISGDERMVVRVCFSFFSTSCGELSFIASDGSVICTQQVNSKIDELDVELPPGPIFNEVLSRIRKNEAKHGDRLTLLYKAKSARDQMEKMRTVIDIFDTTMKLDDYVVHCGREISLIDFSPSKNQGRLYLKSVTKGLKTKLKLVPSAFKDESCLVQSFVSLMKFDGEIELYKETDHICVDRNPWTILNARMVNKLMRKSYSNLLLRLKIVRGTSTQYYQKLFHSRGTSIVPNSASPSEKSSSSSEKSYSPSKKSSSKSLDSVTSNETNDSLRVLVDSVTSNETNDSLRVLDSNNFRTLYHDEDNTDITLKCGNLLFSVHKSVLSAQSPVFKAMLSTEMQEERQEEFGQVVIDDLDPTTLALFLIYLYLGTVENLQWDIALMLLYAADKYQVPSLKKACTEFLCENVSVSNLCNIQDNVLSTVSYDFIFDNLFEALSFKE